MGDGNGKQGRGRGGGKVEGVEVEPGDEPFCFFVTEDNLIWEDF